MISNALEYMEWDSHFFEKEMYNLNISYQNDTSFFNELKQKKNFIQAKVQASESSILDTLQKLEFLFVESEVRFEKPIDKEESTPEFVRFSNQENIATIMNLASHAFKSSRFRHPWFKETDSSRFYAEWSKNAILKTYDDVCLKIESPLSDQILGFVTAKMINSTTAKIGLICVAEKHINQKLGSRLLKAIEQWSIRQGAKKIIVATQGSNLKAISFYLKNGYSLKGLNYWFYNENFNSNTHLPMQK